jgi:hypothetical protein
MYPRLQHDCIFRKDLFRCKVVESPLRTSGLAWMSFLVTGIKMPHTDYVRRYLELTNYWNEENQILISLIHTFHRLINTLEMCISLPYIIRIIV